MRRTHVNDSTARDTTAGTRVQRFARHRPRPGWRSAIERECIAELEVIVDRFASS